MKKNRIKGTMSDYKLLFGASCEGIKKALQDYNNPNIKDNGGKTALHWCITAKTTQLLINSGADINMKDKYGNTPLDLTYNDEKAIILISSGAVYIPDRWATYSHYKRYCYLCDNLITFENQSKYKGLCNLCHHMYKSIYPKSPVNIILNENKNKYKYIFDEDTKHN